MRSYREGWRKILRAELLSTASIDYYRELSYKVRVWKKDRQGLENMVENRLGTGLCQDRTDLGEINSCCTLSGG
jgi:hypothetical protein